MGMEPDAFPEGLPGDDDPGAHILIQKSPTVGQHGPVSGSGKTVQQGPVEAKVGSQHLRDREDDVVVGYPLEAFFREPEGRRRAGGAEQGRRGG